MINKVDEQYTGTGSFSSTPTSRIAEIQVSPAVVNNSVGVVVLASHQMEFSGCSGFPSSLPFGFGWDQLEPR
jgi:hypothetical protein